MKKGILLSLLVFIILSINVYALGAGLAPGRYSITNALKGQEIEYSLRIQSTESRPTKITMSVSGEGNCSKWIKLSEYSFVISGGKKKEIIVKINPPLTLENGVYVCKISATALRVSEAEDGVGMGISTINTATWNIKVTDQAIYLAEITNFKISKNKIYRGEKIEFDFKIKNLGNTEKLLKDVYVEISNSEKIKVDVDFKTIKPNDETEFRVMWDSSKYSEGKYNAKVIAILQNNEQIASNVLSFEVLSPVKEKEISQTTLFIVIVLLFVATVAIVLITKPKRK